MIYAGVQQEGAERGAFGQTKHGSPIPWGDIPAREMFGVSQDDEVEVVHILTSICCPVLPECSTSVRLSWRPRREVYTTRKYTLTGALELLDKLRQELTRWMRSDELNYRR
jgi:hypothetical protein